MHIYNHIHACGALFVVLFPKNQQTNTTYIFRERERQVRRSFVYRARSRMAAAFGQIRKSNAWSPMPRSDQLDGRKGKRRNMLCLIDGPDKV